MKSRTKSKITISLLLVLTQIFGFQISGSSASSPEACKVSNSNGDEFVNIGWPRNPKNLRSTGDVNVLVVGVDFSNVHETGDINSMTSGFNLPKVSNFYKQSSFGKLSLNFTLSSEIVHLVGHDSGETERSITRQVVSNLPSRYDLRKFDAIVSIVTSSSTYTSSSSSAGQTFSNQSGQINNSAVLAGLKATRSTWTPWMVLSHEIGHLFGLMDLWDKNDSLAWQERTAAPYGLMSTGAGWPYNPDFFAWEKWLLGWIPDSDVICLTDVAADFRNAMSKLSATSGTRLVVIKENGALIAIEYRAQSLIDIGAEKEGLLVYKVDLSRRNFDLPISLIASPEALQAPESSSIKDWQRFKTAPLKPLEIVEYNTVKIGRVDVNSKTFIVVSKTSTSELKVALEKIVASETIAVAPPRKTSITCTKGKVTKKVTGVNPSCPKGFKKK